MRNHEVCEVQCVDGEAVGRVKQSLTKHNTSNVANIFKALSDETRVKIAYSLYSEGELCVCDVANIAGSSIASASHHLRLLNKLGLAKSEKRGKLVYYSLDDHHVEQLISLAFDHQLEVENRER
ncbi:metalloregulator ArsR/SmtB family transcription factor [Bacillus lacus]|uniref:Metalloregulator ArsR/SmtB family transcription factor n=1 Tax=Metabacillus lacus TaxID=1983721 RepID=A0A7X2LWI8_9BACI|nr:metalloregulator ArsR/SmtB family transcription factor [Metabacillus lacus]MRX71525.1 metalloregulator ArsR/SmtB family transcription factor [Metabacillus lacus]